MDTEPHQPRPAPRLVQVEAVHSITSARAPHSQELGRRMRNYAISMGIRTLCVVALVVLLPHWTAWLFVPGAVLLPYVAVLLANAGRERSPLAPATVVQPTPERPALGTTRDDAA